MQYIYNGPWSVGECRQDERPDGGDIFPVHDYHGREVAECEDVGSALLIAEAPVLVALLEEARYYIESGAIETADERADDLLTRLTACLARTRRTHGELYPATPEELRTIPEWTAEDDRQAAIEGWGIFNEESAARIQIERIETPDEGEATFCDWEDDGAAVAFVRARSRAGSDLHTRALAYVAYRKAEGDWTRAEADA